MHRDPVVWFPAVTSIYIYVKTLRLFQEFGTKRKFIETDSLEETVESVVKRQFMEHSAAEANAAAGCKQTCTFRYVTCFPVIFYIFGIQSISSLFNIMNLVRVHTDC